MRSIYGILLSILVIPLTLIAADTLPASATFEQVDANSDGYISKAEAIRRDDLAKKWSKIDTDKDDKINIDEFVAYESAGRFAPPEDAETPELGAAPTQ